MKSIKNSRNINKNEDQGITELRVERTKGRQGKQHTRERHIKEIQKIKLEKN